MKPFTGQTELTEAGFVHYETCYCGGILQHKFKKSGDKKTRNGYLIEYRVFPTVGRYKKFKFNSMVGHGLSANIKTHLNEQSS